MARPFYSNLTVQVLTAIVVGGAIGYFAPEAGKSLKPLGDAFIAAVKMIVAPVVFLTIVVGIAGMRDLRKAGKVGIKALAYFLVFTTLALLIGMVVANVLKPGKGVKPAEHQASAADDAKLKKIKEDAAKQTTTGFLLNIIPKTFVSAFVEGEMLQVLFVALLFGVALAGLGDHGVPMLNALEMLAEVMFRIVALLMRFAPLGALGAMAFTIGEHGLGVLGALAKLMAGVYLTSVAFVFVVLWAVCAVSGFSLFGYLRFIKDEILLVLGTSSSESALPRMIEKLELIGCSRPVVGLVIPAGYSFNLDGTSIYLSMAALFIAQAMNVELTLGEQAYMLGILVLTSKGAAAITGGGFITLAATLGVVHPELIPGLTIVFAVDRFMSEARAITNLIGNGVATIVVSKWEGAFDRQRYELAMAGHPLNPLAAPPGGFPVEITADLAREPSAGMER